MFLIRPANGTTEFLRILYPSFPTSVTGNCESSSWNDTKNDGVSKLLLQKLLVGGTDIKNIGYIQKLAMSLVVENF